MSGEAAVGGEFDFERLLAEALRPIEPPENLTTRVETTLSRITEQAAAELSSWAGEFSEGELEALRDPRNWVRPVVAITAGSAAAGALLVLGLRNRHRAAELREFADSVLKQVRG